MVRRLLVAIAMVALTAASVVVTTTPQVDAASTFRGWQFDTQISSTRFDGLALNDVSYNGVKVFDRISMPAMSVFYDNNICGPYLDRIGGSSYDYEAPQEFTQNGVRWLSLGLTDQIGNYVITQMFYMSENGDFDAHMFSRGLQCNVRHDHVPFWRIDFDIAGGETNDQVRRATSSGMTAMTNEFSLSATAAVGHGWEVHDTATGDFVTIDFDDGSFNIGGTVVPETNYVQNKVFGRQYKSNEETWQGGPSSTLFGNQGESISDLVLWYSGFMPHSPVEGPDLWHSTGIRMQVNPSQGATSISGRVTDVAGNGMNQVKVDLFTENRASFIGSTRTDSAGNFSFSLSGGACRVLTFIAPDGATFSGGGRYQNTAVCVASGQNAGGNNATVVTSGGGVASVGDRVTLSDGSGAAGVRLNLFTENRAQFLGVTTTDGNGNYRFDLASPRCGVVTFIAPSGYTFDATGTGYRNRSFCAGAGEHLTNIDAVLVGGGSAAVLGDRVTNANGSGQGGVKIVLYRANANGSRGQWLRSTFTAGDGSYDFVVGSGCYVLDFVAPDGRSWASTGGRYQQLSSCVGPGETDNSLDGVLN